MTQKTGFSRRQVVVLLVCVSLFALGQFHRASGSVFTPVLMDAYAVSAATVGGLVSAMFFASIVAQVPFGILLDRYGPRGILTLCVWVIGFGTCIFAFAQSFEAAFLSRIIIGLGMASMAAANYVIIARNFPASDFGFVSGLVVTLGGIGGLLGTYPLALALSRMPWPLVFGCVAALTFLLSLFVFRAVRPGTAQAKEDDESDTSFWYLLRQAEFLKILALSFVSFAPITAISGLWGGPFFQDVTGLSPETTGAVLMLLFVATISAGFLFGIVDRYARSRKVFVLCGVALSSTSLFVLASVPSPTVAVALGLLLSMVFFQQFYIPLGAHMRQIVPEHLIGRASTTMAMVSVSAIPILQVSFGVILDMTAGWGWPIDAQYRAAFGAMGTLIATLGLNYSSVKRAGGAVRA